MAHEFSIATTLDNARHGLVENQVDPTHPQIFNAYAQLVKAAVDISPYDDRNFVLALGALEIFGEQSVQAFYGCGEPDYRISHNGQRYRIDSTIAGGLSERPRRHHAA